MNTSHLPALSDWPGGGYMTTPQSQDQSHSWRFAHFLFLQWAVREGSKLPCESMIFRRLGSQPYRESQFHSRKSLCTQEDTSTMENRGWEAQSPGPSLGPTAWGCPPATSWWESILSFSLELFVFCGLQPNELWVKYCFDLYIFY